jgi:hypothetical protein
LTALVSAGDVGLRRLPPPPQHTLPTHSPNVPIPSRTHATPHNTPPSHTTTHAPPTPRPTCSHQLCCDWSSPPCRAGMFFCVVAAPAGVHGQPSGYSGPYSTSGSHPGDPLPVPGAFRRDGPPGGPASLSAPLPPPPPHNGPSSSALPSGSASFTGGGFGGGGSTGGGSGVGGGVGGSSSGGYGGGVHLGEASPSLPGDNPSSMPLWASRPKGPVQQLASIGLAVMPASPPTAPGRTFGGGGGGGGSGLGPSSSLSVGGAVPGPRDVLGPFGGVGSGPGDRFGGLGSSGAVGGDFGPHGRLGGAGPTAVESQVCAWVRGV